MPQPAHVVHTLSETALRRRMDTVSAPPDCEISNPSMARWDRSTGDRVTNDKPRPLCAHVCFQTCFCGNVQINSHPAAGTTAPAAVAPR